MPGFPRVSDVVRLALGRLPIELCGGMRYDTVGRTILDVDVTAIRLPSGNFGCKFLVAKDYAAIMLVPKRIVVRCRFGIALIPELLDEDVALLIGIQF